METNISTASFHDFALNLKTLVERKVNIDELVINIDISRCVEIEEIFKVISGSRKTKDAVNREKYEQLLDRITDVNIFFSITRGRYYAGSKYDYKVETPNGEKECEKFFIETFCKGDDEKLFCADLYQKARFKFIIAITNPNETRVVNEIKYAGENFWNQISEDIQNKNLLKGQVGVKVELIGKNIERLTGDKIVGLCRNPKRYAQYIQRHKNKIILVNVSSRDIFAEEFRVSLLFGLKGLKDPTLKFKQYILILNLDEKEYYRACTYLSAIVNDNFIVLNKDEFRFNEIKIKEDNQLDFGNLLPACYIDDNILNKFRRPIGLSAWDTIRGKEKITKDTLECFDASIKILWPYFRICQRFLFEEFSDNESKPYTKLRNTAYGQDDFYKDYVGKIPFLALMVFAIYDAFYRSHLLQAAKDYYGTSKLQLKDFLLSRQSTQDQIRFDRYEENKELFDIKNLLLNFDETNQQCTFHPTVISEIIESVSISEGILQLLENAVRHADGGLFSLRIFSRARMLKKEGFRVVDHVTYLNNIYGDYYFEQYEKLNRHAVFYLDLQISDLAEMSIPQKFYENHKKHYEANRDVEAKTWQIVSNAWDKKLINLGYFFAPEKNQRDIRADFYAADEGKNLIYHYGLDIFRTIVENRKGIFSVSGYGLRYSNLLRYYDEAFKIEEIKNSLAQFSISVSGQKFFNKIEKLLGKKLKHIEESVGGSDYISGTHYRILLPLGHDSLGDGMRHGENVIVQQDDKLVFQYKSLIDLTEAIKTGVGEVEAIRYEANQANQSEKPDDIITNILTRLREKYIASPCIYYINWERIEEQSEDWEIDYEIYFEEIVKAVLLFALNVTKEDVNDERRAIKFFPLALINMTDFQLLNAARIIATYYSKSHREKYQPFQYVQIYLKSQTVGTEVIFAGETLEDVKSNFIKSAMTNGIMFQEITTIWRMMESFSSNS